MPRQPKSKFTIDLREEGVHEFMPNFTHHSSHMVGKDEQPVGDDGLAARDGARAKAGDIAEARDVDGKTPSRPLNSAR